MTLGILREDGGSASKQSHLQGGTRQHDMSSSLASSRSEQALQLAGFWLIYQREVHMSLPGTGRKLVGKVMM